MALTVCRTLREVADSGRLVVASIHQPSSRAFNYFTHVMLLAAGHVAYYGRSDALISYLAG
jgi:ABC-type multidrug transport system ATPase subunit